MEYKYCLELSMIGSELTFPTHMIKNIYYSLIFSSLVATSNAVVIFDDAVDGNASSDGSAPTSLTFSLGSNEVLGTVSTGAPINNTRNFYTFSIGEGKFYNPSLSMQSMSQQMLEQFLMTQGSMHSF